MKLSIDERQSEQPHSVEISISGRGLWSTKVKTYAKTPKTAMKQTLSIIKDLEVLLKEKNRGVQ